MRRRTTRLFAGVVVLGLLAAACGGDDGDDAASGTTSGSGTTSADGGAAPSGDPIRLAALVPFSGPQASLGQFAQQGADIAVEFINEAGGVLGRPIEVVYKDDEAQTDAAVRVFREAIDEDIPFTFGYPTSAICLAVAPIATQLNGLMMSSFCQTNKMTHENFEENFFRVTTTNEMLTRAGTHTVQEKVPDAKKWVTIAPDYEYGHNTVNIFKNDMRENLEGFEVLGETFPPFQTPTYNDYITQVANLPADGVYSSLFAGDQLTMLRQAVPFNLLEGKVFLTQGMDLDVLEPMGESGNTPEGWNSMVYHYEAFDNELNTRFIEAMQEKHGTVPTLYRFNGFISVYAYAAAIEAAGSTDVDEVKAALEGLEFDTPAGALTFRPEDHQAIYESIAVVNVVPTDTPEGFEIAEFVLIPGDEVTSPADPGNPNPFDAES
ncbi:MAG: ABC transporter substrate-binding protein [Acidimicrobiia bacterium]|nr:ABC transporter substrate-binding protein [Acidimicrobiia bacterium]